MPPSTAVQRQDVSWGGGGEKAEGSQGPGPNRVGGTPSCSAVSAGEGSETLRALLFYFSVKTVNVILYLK